jgi:hypothetical protein
VELLRPKDRKPRRKTGGSQRKYPANGHDEQSAYAAEPSSAGNEVVTGEPSSAGVVNPVQQSDGEPSSAVLLNPDQRGAEAGSAEVVNPVQQQKKLSKETNQKKLSKGEDQPPVRPAPFPSTWKAFMGRIGEIWQSAQARMQTDNPRATLFLHVRMAAKMQGLEYEQAKQFLADHPGWKDWPDLNDLDSQQQIEFPEPPKNGRVSEAEYVIAQRGDVGAMARQLFFSFREHMKERLEPSAFQTLVAPMRLCCLTETELHVIFTADGAQHVGHRLHKEIAEWLPQQLSGIRFLSADLEVCA